MRDKVVNGWVSYIGGVPGAGKSAIAARVGEHHRVGVTEMDVFLRIMKTQGASQNAISDAMPQLARTLVTDALITGQTRIFVGWVAPVVAVELKQHGEFHPIYCGYPNASPKAKLMELYASATNGDDAHWITAQLTYSDALRKLAELIEQSRHVRDKCGDLGLPFFDLSDLAAGQSRVFEYFRDLIEPSKPT